jgi:hypothetical protein
MTDAGLDDWVVTEPVPEVARRLQTIREGIRVAGKDHLRPRPAEVMRLLKVFALHRSIDDLLRIDPAAADTAGFDALDVRIVLALATLTRPVGQAAQLAIKQWTKESGQGAADRPLTRDLVHDITAQRVVPEVAEFVSTCRQEPYAAQLVTQTLRAFVAAASGRTTLDKAALFIELRARGCEGEADTLLELALQAAAAPAGMSVPEGRVGIVGALRHLSPSETIVEDWITRRMADDYKQGETMDLVAGLIVGEPESNGKLAEYVGRTWRARRVIDLCERLARSSKDRCALVRGYAAVRSERDFLAEIITYWHKSVILSGTFRDLLADIVAVGADRDAGPRTIEFLEKLRQALLNDRAPGRCLSELRVAVAAHVWDRTGTETAQLLGQVVGSRELRRAAQAVNQRLTSRLLAGETAAGAFVEYLQALREQRNTSTLTFLALRELTDPVASDHALEGTASVIGEIAAQLYGLGMADVGFDLLERCLENDQWLRAEDVAGIVGHVRLSAMTEDERWDSLLGATVGRWAEWRRRDDVVAELRRQSFSDEAEAVIHFVQ